MSAHFLTIEVASTPLVDFLRAVGTDLADERWPGDWELVRFACNGRGRRIDEAFQRLRKLARVIEEEEGVEGWIVDSLDGAEGVAHWRLELAVVRESPALCEAVVEVIRQLEQMPYFRVDYRMARRRVGIEDALGALGFVDERTEEEERENDEEWEEEEDTPDDEPEDVRPAWGDTHSRGGFGGLGGEPERQRKAPPRLPADARLFLEVTRLAWPTGKREVRAAFRKCAPGVHPDTNPRDAGANERFRRYVAGYEWLCREAG